MKFKTLVLITSIFLTLSVSAQNNDLTKLISGFESQPAVASSISSSPTGGKWSVPSTWVGGVVPTAGDDVTIVGGATVAIDTAAAVNSMTVGGPGSIAGAKGRFAEGTLPAVLKFGETSAFSLTVTGDVTIGSNDSLTTGGGNANQHVLTVGGNLTNNGTLDLSTNNNQAAAMLVFTGASNNTFGGSGPVTDISWITIEKGTTSGNILELSVANFSVRGSVTDTPDSGFLFLNHGTFKISGTFTLSNRTFFTTPYEIATVAGLWLNNPNYTIVAQHQAEVQVFGYLRVTAGTYNIGTALDDSLVHFHGSTVLIEGGAINVAGRFIRRMEGSAIPTYIQSGGIVTTCTVGQTSTTFACFEMTTNLGTSLLAGGTIVIQNPIQSGNASDFRFFATTGHFLANNATLQFGNEFTPTGRIFRASGELPNIVVFETQTLVEPGIRTKNVEVRPGARLEGGFSFYGETFLNNGTIKLNQLSFFGDGDNQTYSGSGITDGPVGTLDLGNDSLTLDSVNNLRVRKINFNSGSVINSGKMTLGNNDNLLSTINFSLGGNGPEPEFDSPLTFELGTGGQTIAYNNFSFNSTFTTTGGEINPARTLVGLSFKGANSAPSSLTIAGGDLTVTGTLNLIKDPIITGPNRLIHYSSVLRQTGYVDGTLVTRLAGTGTFIFHVGQNGYSPVTATVTALGVNPSFLSVKPVDTTLPGLLPANSASRYWQLEEIGDITATLTFEYTNADVRGSEPNYALWRSTGGPPVMIAGSIPLPNSNTVSTPGAVTAFNGDWGIGGQLDPGPVSISGGVFTSGGQPIRNATMTITGGFLPGPVQAQTGNFGTYTFNGLQAGETYTVRVDAKRYRFTPPTQLVTPMNNVQNVNFTANPQE